MRSLLLTTYSLLMLISAQSQVIRNPSFQTKWSVDFHGTYRAFDVPVSDFNGDGKADVFVCGDTAAAIFLNYSNDLVTQFDKWIIEKRQNNSLYKSTISEDFNKDGLDDLAWITGTNGAYKLMIYQHQLTGTIHQFNAVDSMNIGFSFGQISSGDLDGDEKAEIIVTGRTDQNIYIFKNSSSNSIVSFQPEQSFNVLINTSAVVCADLDGDNKKDLAFASDANSGVAILKNQSTGSLAFELISLSTSAPANFIQSAEIDNQGNPELMIGFLDQGFAVFRNQSTGGAVSFADMDQFNYNYESRPLSFLNIHAADMDNDGDLDLVCGVADYALMATRGYGVILENEGNIGSVSFRSAKAAMGSIVHGIGVADFRESGNQDVVGLGSNDHTGQLLFMENRFAQPVNLELCPPAGSISLDAERQGTVYQWQISANGIDYSNIEPSVFFQNPNTATLMITMLPSSYNGQLVRCKVDGDAGKSQVFKLAYINRYIQFPVIGGNTDFANPSNWSCGSLPDENTNVIIQQGHAEVLSSATIYSLNILISASINIQTGVVLEVLH